MRKLLLVAAALAGCAPSIGVQWEPLPSLVAPPRSRYPKNTPAVLLKQEHVADVFNGRRDRHAMEQYHEAKAILTQAGLAQAEVKLHFGKKTRLKTFQARTVEPDGRVVPVDASQVFRAQNTMAEDSGGEDFVTHVFRFPEAQVGSVLEYMYELELDYIPTFLWRRLDDGLPVEKYEARLEYNDKLRVETKVYNADAPFVPQSRFESTVWKLALGPLPGNVDEPFRPSHRETEARWISRIRGYVGASQYYDWSEGWPAAMEPFAKLRYVRSHDENPSRGADGVALDAAATAKCRQDTRCLVELALATTREKTEIDGFRNRIGSRRVTAIAASGHASNHEKAVLLRHYLDRAGVRAWYAFSSRQAPLDAATPDPSQFDHELLWLPAQPGLPAQLWLDPSCEDCAAGEIPPWDVGADALVVMGEDPRFGAFKTSTRLDKIAGAPKLTDETALRFDVAVAESGDAEVTEEIEWRGEVARGVIHDRRKESERERQEKIDQGVLQRLPSARIRESSSSCDRAAGRCVARILFSLPGYGAVDGKKLALPLTLFRDSDLAEPERERRYDVRIASGGSEDETITFHAPPGFAFAEAPNAAVVTERSAAARFDVTVRGDTAVAHRALERRAGRYPKSEWPRLAGAYHQFAGFRRALVTLERR